MSIRGRGAGLAQVAVVAGLVLAALLACKKDKSDEDLPDVEIPEAEPTEESTVPSEPAATDTAEPPADPAAAATDQVPVVPTATGTATAQPRVDAGAAPTVDAGAAAPVDAGTAAPVDAGGATPPPGAQACATACQGQLVSCMRRIAESGGARTECHQELRRCMAACSQ